MIKSFALKTILALGALPLGIAAMGQSPQSSEVLFKGGYAEIIFDPEYIPTLGLKVGFKTFILLPSDEKIIRVEPGVRGTAIEIKYGANWVALRPNIEKLTTNIHIATDQGRVYTFNMIEGGGPHKEPHQKVVVIRPDMELDADGGPQLTSPAPAPANRNAAPVKGPVTVGPQPIPVATQPHTAERALPAVVGMDDDSIPVRRPPSVPGVDVLRKLDDGYKIKNEKPNVFAIQKVYNDGQRTFVVFKTAMLEAPLFYRVTPEGKREVLTYRMDPARDPRDSDVFIIPRLVDRGTVKVGDYEATFIWKKAE